MTEHVWDELLTDLDARVISKSGYAEGGASSWDSRDVGGTPSVLVIDMQRFIVNDNVPILDAIENHQIAIGENAWAAMDEIASVIETARENNVPVAHTRVIPQAYDDPSHEDLAIVEEVAPEPGETIIDKSYSSAFYGTDLRTRLRRQGIDTLVIVGNTTSGCIRATVVDAQQHGFDVVVPQECVFDRIEASHKIALLDMWMKYASVMDRAAAESYLSADEE
ncbi:MAG: isochorismatase family protein [Halapricum sp.]